MLRLAGVRVDDPACALKLRLDGLTLKTAAAAAFTVRVTNALLLGSDWLVAVTVTEVGVDTDGAVNMPEEFTDPAVVDHVTAGFAVLLTVAISCWVPPEATVAVEGDSATITGEVRANVASRPIATTPSESRDRALK